MSFEANDSSLRVISLVLGGRKPNPCRRTGRPRDQIGTPSEGWHDEAVQAASDGAHPLQASVNLGFL
jgi:hypothetical protein